MDDGRNEGEERELEETLGRRLRNLESEELLQLERELRALLAMPGWDRLGELLTLHRNTVKRNTEKVIWTHLTMGRSLDRAGPLNAAAGRIRGMREPFMVIEKVLELARVVKLELGINPDEE